MKKASKILTTLVLGAVLMGASGCHTGLYLGGNITKGKTTIGVGKSTNQNGVSIYIGHRMGKYIDGYTTGNLLIDDAIERKQLQVIEPTRVLPQEIAKVVYKEYNMEPEDIAKTKFYGYSIDLNGDGKEEQIVVLGGQMFSGTGGDSMVILQEGASEGTYEVMQDFTLIRLPLVVEKLKKGQEYSNIYLHASGGGAKSRDICLKYENGRYQTVNEASEVTDYAKLKEEEAFILVE